VIFVGHRRPKQGHNAIAQDLIHRPLKAVHGVHHVLQRGIEEALRGFGVEVTDQLRRAFEVGKQDGDLLPFAFQRTARGEDLLRQIGWSIRQGGGRRRYWGRD